MKWLKGQPGNPKGRACRATRINMTWWEKAEEWLRANLGWHESREIAEAINYTYLRNISGILHRIPGIQYQWRGPLQQNRWRLDG